ncbi:MAG: TonB-dependent receptor [Bacteroidetes bacterium]|nr:MAG: TonB-dependent receptor [Bacteroidota bacterium]
MTKKWIFAISFLLTSTVLRAQTVLKGQIREEHVASPVSNATITIQNGPATVSDENGNFEFHGIRSGTYNIKVSSIGYKSLEKEVSTSNSSIIIELEKINLMLQPIEIRTVRAEDKSPFAKTNIQKPEIEKANLGQDLPFLLNQTPSTVINSDAGNGVGYTALRIRGTDATRINVTLNGIPYNDAESQGTYFVDLPDFSSSVSSMQIQRGVGTSANGAGAFGATINMSTNEFNPTAYGELNNSYGSFNTWKNTIKVGSGLIADHFTIDARLSQIKSDGYIDRASSDLKSFYLSGAYYDKNNSLRLNIFSGKEKTYQAWNGIPEAKLKGDQSELEAHYERNIGSLYFTTADSLNLFQSNNRTYNYFTYQNQTDNYQQDHAQLFYNHSFNDHLSFNTAFFLIRGKGYYEEFKPQQYYADYGLDNPVYGTDTITQTDLIRQLWLDNYFYGNITSLQFKNDRTQWIVGGGWNRYDGAHYGDIIWTESGGAPNNYEWYRVNALKTDFNIYGKIQRKLSDHWDGFADLQYRRVKYNLDGFQENPSLIIHNLYNFFNPKIGFTYSNREWRAFASYAISNKEPNRDDFEAGLNQQPKYETLNDFELGIEKRNYVFSWGATFYYMHYHNQLVLTGKVNDVGSYTRTNIPVSYRSGVELVAKWRPAPWFIASGNFTVSQNKVKDFTEYLDDYDQGGQKQNQYAKSDIALSPNLIGSANISFVPNKNWELSFLSKYVSKQFLDNTSQDSRTLNAYFVEDFRAIYTVNNFIFKTINVIGQVNNIFNKKYEPNGYTYSYIYGGETVTENFYYPMAGTNFMLALNVKL